MKVRGKAAKVSPEELNKIAEMKKTLSAREVSRLTGRSMLVVVYADKPKPENKKRDFFNYKDRSNWLI